MKNVFQAIAVAIGGGMFDDLPFEESEVNSLFANLSGLQALFAGAHLDGNLVQDVTPKEDLAT